MTKKYIAELVGTFVLTFAVALSLEGRLVLTTPLVAGIALGLMVYVIGSISGAHVNPAITVGLWSLKKIGSKEATYYIIFQFIGAALALWLSRTMVSMPNLVVNNNLSTFFGEMLGAFFFSFGVAAVATDRVPAAANGLVVGGSLFLGICAASFLGNAVLNPAVALGISSFSFAYLLGPIAGALLGMQLFGWLTRKNS